MQFEIKILGANSASPVYNRHQTAQLLYIEPHYLLIDCGEATQHQLLRYKCKIAKIDYIFISHLHGDHYLGLVGLISTMHLQGRNKELFLFGPAGLEEIITVQMKLSETVLNYRIVFKALDATRVDTILELDKFTVSTIPLNHRISCCGFLFREKPKKRRVNKDLFPANGSLAHMAMLKLGQDVLDGNGDVLYENAKYTLPPKKSRSYAYCSDTRLMMDNVTQLSGVDVLYHETTFTHDLLERAVTTFHTTALEAGQFASACKAGLLIIGHYSSRYKELVPLLDEAKTQFDQVTLAIEGEDYVILE